MRRNLTWTTAIYARGLDEAGGAGRPLRLFTGKPLLRRPSRPHTIADPCLFVHDGQLYLLVETKVGREPGRIDLWRSADLLKWRKVDWCLRSGIHYSYPNVVVLGGRLHLIVETAAVGEVQLFELRLDERKPRFVRALIGEGLLDPTPVHVDGTWYVFGTRDDALVAYQSDDLIGGAVTPHPAGAITRDPRHARCAGAFLTIEGRLHRLSQDGSSRYGENVNLHLVEELSPERYAERLVRSAILPTDRWWNRAGAHHLSQAEFGGRTVTAVDGQAYDHLHHRLTDRFTDLVARLRPSVAAGAPESPQ